MDGLTEKGKRLLVLIPSTEIITLALASATKPSVYPHVIAYKTQSSPFNPPQLTLLEQDLRQDAYQRALASLGLLGSAIIDSSLTRRESDVTNEDLPLSKLHRGAAVYELTNTDPYSIVYPCQVAGLNTNRSIVQLRNDLSLIWTAAIVESLQMKEEQFPQLSVVLIVPDNYSVGDVEVMVDTLFVDMKFKEVVVHSDSMAAVFGQGISGACVVNVDDGSIRVRCIEDGSMLSGSLRLLPFGGRHMCHALEWMLQETLPSEFNASKRLSDRRQLEKMRDSVCFLPQEGTESALIVQIQNLPSIQWNYHNRHGNEQLELRIGTVACLAPMGLFYPELLVPYSSCTPSQLTSPTEEHYAQIIADSDSAKLQNTVTEIDALPLPLDAAVVQSISSVQNVDHRRRFYTNILVVGSCSRLKGLSDMLERCVLSALPSDEVIDTVAVLEPKSTSDQIIWKGGCVLALLSDHWVSREEWIHGANLDKPNKFGKREIARSKLYWMFKTETGMM